MDYKYWKWSSNDESMKKTKRNTKVKEIEERIRDNQIETLKYMHNKDEKNNNKEISSKRLSERQQVKQRVFNPFLSNNNYLSDLQIQEDYLKPKNSNYVQLEE